ncbi:MAG: hypothetical protein ACRCV0_03015 [Brevinema sp.]
MKIRSVLPFFLLLSSCGIETPQGLPKLFTPNGVLIKEGSETPSRTLTICWTGLNPEDDFTGYNIYYTRDKNSALSLNGRRLPNISGGNSTDSTFLVSFPVFTARKFTFLLNRDLYRDGFEDLKASGPIFIYIKAHSQTRAFESEPSGFAEGQFD